LEIIYLFLSNSLILLISIKTFKFLLSSSSSSDSFSFSKDFFGGFAIQQCDLENIDLLSSESDLTQLLWKAIATLNASISSFFSSIFDDLMIFLPLFY